MSYNLEEKIQSVKNIGEAFYIVSSNYPNEAVYSKAIISSTSSNGNESLRTWQSESFSIVQEKVFRLANYLSSIGIKKGDAVSIISYTRPEWMIADLAILSIGAVSVSVYQSITKEETGYILFDSSAKIVFAENEEQVTKLKWLLNNHCPIPETEDRNASNELINIAKIIVFEDVASNPLITSLDAIFKMNEIPTTPPQAILTTTREDVASLVYTSGTTGPPKGVIQTHGNHLANLWQASKTKLFAPEGDIFLFLPLAHSFARLIGYIGFLSTTEIKFPAVVSKTSSALNPASILQDLREGNCQVVPTVPRILEKMVSGIRAKTTGEGIGAILLRITVNSALSMRKANNANQIPSVLNKLSYHLTSFIRRKIKIKLFGNKFQHAISGGAKLPIEVGEFLLALGIDVYEGYGLTETCVATNVNPLGRNVIGSVGPVLEKVELKIAEDGEILFRGPNISKGYHNRPTATKNSWDNDGWFHTGDLGQVDEKGYLFITGRKKELIVTAGGKKIAPQPIEEKLQFSPYISQCLLYGDGQPYCIAIITLDIDAVRSKMASEKIKVTGELHQDPKVVELIQKEIDSINQTLSKFETIKAFKIINEDFTVENGMLTPTFKVKRNAAYKKYKDLIESIYI
jgi:long-chain acyl-CoA synthetase